MGKMHIKRDVNVVLGPAAAMREKEPSMIMTIAI
jgi:hypothetical protein